MPCMVSLYTKALAAAKTTVILHESSDKISCLYISLAYLFFIVYGIRINSILTKPA
jgi:hypothetical protein